MSKKPITGSPLSSLWGYISFSTNHVTPLFKISAPTQYPFSLSLLWWSKYEPSCLGPEARGLFRPHSGWEGIWVSILSKADCPFWSRWAISNQLKAQREQKGCTSPESEGLLPFDHMQTGTSALACLQVEGKHWFLMLLEPVNFQSRTYAIGAPGSQAFRRGLEPRPPWCQGQAALITRVSFF